jgi:F-type H+-transporting ATPase subunit a
LRPFFSAGAVVAVKCNISKVAASFLAILAASPAYAEGLPHVINYYDIILHTLHLDPMWVPTLGALLATVILAFVGFAYRSAVARSSSTYAPEGMVNVRFAVESCLSPMYGLAQESAGDDADDYFPFLGGIFLFVLVNNLMGLVPGFPPATESMDTNVAMGIVVFLVYNWAGIKEHGAGYIKHFLGPVAFIAPLFFCIELVSHGSRPLSLGLRLAGNIYGDHTLLSVFTSLTYLVFPAGLMFFGLLVAVVQSYVFALLSSIYLSMALSHDH